LHHLYVFIYIYTFQYSYITLQSYYVVLFNNVIIIILRVIEESILHMTVTRLIVTVPQSTTMPTLWLLSLWMR